MEKKKRIKRLMILANDWIGRDIVSFLMKQDVVVVGLGIHSPVTEKYSEEIIKIAHVPSDAVFEATRLHDPEVLAAVRSLAPDMIICAYWGYILKSEFIMIPPYGCVNLHPSYLPYNRGKNPNVWPLIDGTPAGATVHYIDPGIDTGDIIAQRSVPVDPVDTAQTLYQKTTQALVDVFKKIWPALQNDQAPRIPQVTIQRDTHYARDMRNIEEIDLDKNYSARALINILRARTFPPHSSAYYWDQEKRISIRVQLTYADEEKAKK